MRGVDLIRAAERNLAARAAAEGREPFLVEREDVEDWLDALALGRIPTFPFRLLGEHVPERWEATDRTLLVDMGGGERAGALALAMNRMVSSLEPGLGYAITRDRDSLVTLAEYRRCGEPSRG